MSEPFEPESVVSGSSVEQMQIDYLQKRVSSLSAQVERLHKLLAESSCCCSGCTKHNLALSNEFLDGIGPGEL